MARVYIGTSGWVYAWWRGVFYPERLPQREWLNYYVSRFPTVEINATFYRLPKPQTFRHWREIAPRGFVYAVKASRFITHVKRLKPDEESLALFLEAARELGSSLGPILYQLPPNLKKDVTLLKNFAKRLPSDLTHVFEFRASDWFTPDVRAVLGQNNLGFCIHDHWGVDVPHWVTGSTAYWRFHGRSGGPEGCYGRKALRSADSEIRAQLAENQDVYVYFNNDAYGCAIRDAQRLADLIQGEEGRELLSR